MRRSPPGRAEALCANHDNQPLSRVPPSTTFHEVFSYAQRSVSAGLFKGRARCSTADSRYPGPGGLLGYRIHSCAGAGCHAHAGEQRTSDSHSLRVGDRHEGRRLTVTVNWGDGTTSTVDNTTSSATDHTYAQLGTYTITVTADDGQGDSVSDTITGVRTAGSEYTSYGPQRILDTRKGIGAPVAPVKKGATLKLHVVGAGPTGDTIPAGITAVVLNVTVTQPATGGYVAV